ncbi:hypothetical protein [Halobacillus salinus]|uniref:hypothetical protein n=1 Tax=Halobacillus salinus TaxID=192814 RepID=UPI0009A56C86|nr:hypothetical protein [Halobacillus salinus]
MGKLFTNSSVLFNLIGVLNFYLIMDGGRGFGGMFSGVFLLLGGVTAIFGLVRMKGKAIPILSLAVSVIAGFIILLTVMVSGMGQTA